MQFVNYLISLPYKNHKKYSNMTNYKYFSQVMTKIFGIVYRKNSNDRYVLLDRTLDAVILTTNDFKQAKQEAIEWADYDDILTQVVDKTTGKTLFQVNGSSDAMNYLDECAGVGVIASKKQAKDPRYSMSLTKDVRPGQIKKSLSAFKLESK